MTLFLPILLTIYSYFTVYPTSTKEATDFIDQHPEISALLSESMSKEEAIIALAIVAPEISQYSTVFDMAQQRSLSISYMLYGQGNFSVGYFQMKPSFAETIEKAVSDNEALRRQHPRLIFNEQQDDDNMVQRRQRHDRLVRLASLEWQCHYLAAFISIVKQRTENIPFESDEEKLRYWATLYNAGVYLSESQVKERQEKQQFPHFGFKKFNYSAVATEFYQYFKGQ